MKNIDKMSKDELEESFREALTRNIELTEEVELLYSRLDVVNARLDEAIDECLKTSSRLIKAKEEYRKLREELFSVKNKEGGIDNGNVD